MMNDKKNDRIRKTVPGETVFRVLAEGGSMGIRRFQAPDGSWRFIASTDESTLADFLDEDDQIELVREHPAAATFKEALGRLNKYFWPKMHIDVLHPEYAELISIEMLKKFISRRTQAAARKGELTSGVGEEIERFLRHGKFRVYYDHGEEASEAVGKIVSSIRSPYKRRDELAQLDIVIVNEKNDALVLIEIEETSDRPKTFLSDVFGILTGNFITPPGGVNPINVSSQTVLIVLGKGRDDHKERNDHIRDQVMAAKPYLGTGNSQIGTIIVESFSSNEDLAEKLGEHISQAMKRFA